MLHCYSILIKYMISLQLFYVKYTIDCLYQTTVTKEIIRNSNIYLSLYYLRRWLAISASSVEISVSHLSSVQ